METLAYVLAAVFIGGALFIAGRISMMTRRHRHQWVVTSERAPGIYQDGIRTQHCLDDNCDAEAIAVAKWPQCNWHIVQMVNS